MTLPLPSTPAEVEHMVADDHAVVERQFQNSQQKRGDRRRLADQVIFELTLHATAEERTLYPALVTAELGELAERSLAEHGEVKDLLVRLQRSEPGEDDWSWRSPRSWRTVRSHVNEEETEVLAALRSRTTLEPHVELGRRISSGPSEPRPPSRTPTAPTPPPGTAWWTPRRPPSTWSGTT